MIRKVFLTITVVLLLIVLTLYHAWQSSRVNTSIKNLILPKVHALVGDEWRIEKMHFGFGTLNLEGVQLVNQQSPYQIDIEEVTLGYSFSSLVRGALRPEKTVEEITLYQPRLTLRYNSRKQTQEAVDLQLDLTDDATEHYRSLMKEYDFIKRITIREGEILIHDRSTNERTLMAKQINGWASTNEKGKAWVRMAGHIFKTNEYNTVIYGQLDLKRGGLDNINIDLHDYSITNELPFLQPDYIEFQNGVVNGQLTVTERHEPDRGFDITGNVRLEDGQVKLASENLYFSDVNIAAEIKDWNLEIKEAHQYINGTPTRLEGRIINLIDPRLDLHLSSDRFDIADFVQQVQPEVILPLYGSTQFDVIIKEALESPKMHGVIAADSLYFYQKKIEDFKVDLDFEGQSMAFPQIAGDLEGGKISGSGRMDYTDGERQLNFDINFNSDFGEDLKRFGMTGVEKCLTTCDLSIFGTLDNPVSTGKISVDMHNRFDESITLDGSLNFTKKTGLFLSAVTSGGEGFTMTASIQDMVSKPTFDLDATNIENLMIFIKDPALAYIRKNFSINITAEGTADDIRINLGGLRQNSYEKVFEIKGYSGSLVLFPNNPVLESGGKFHLAVTEEAVSLSNLSVGNWLEAEFFLPKSPHSERKGRCYVSGLQLPLLLSLLDQETQNYDGELYGEVSLNGNLANPKYNGELWLLDGTVGDVRPVKGELTFSADSERLQVKKLNFEDAQSFNFVSEGSYDFRSRELEARVASANLDMNELITLITGRRDVIQGKAMIQISMTGRLPEIPVFGRINVHKAEILDFSFDEAVFDFGSQDSSNSSYFSDAGFYSGNTSLVKQEEFVLNGSSFLPFKGESSLDVQLAGEGNFLSLLSDILPDLMLETDSQGHLKFRMSDWYTHPRFAGSQFEFENGFLRLSEVAQEIEQIEGKLAVSEDDYFLNVEKLQGTVRQQPFSITTTREISGLNHADYSPLRIGGDDLNLGAIRITTPPEGVPINIPGVMEKGELGWFYLTGYNHGYSSGTNGTSSEEHFFMTGPWERPKVRGKVYIQNANLMFPFDERSDDTNPIVENVIKSIDWDVIAVAKNDTRYERQFPGIYVNMEINKGDTLDFEGILNRNADKLNISI